MLYDLNHYAVHECKYSIINDQWRISFFKISFLKRMKFDFPKPNMAVSAEW